MSKKPLLYAGASIHSEDCVLSVDKDNRISILIEDLPEKYLDELILTNGVSGIHVSLDIAAIKDLT